MEGGERVDWSFVVIWYIGRGTFTRATWLLVVGSDRHLRWKFVPFVRLR